MANRLSTKIQTALQQHLTRQGEGKVNPALQRSVNISMPGTITPPAPGPTGAPDLPSPVASGRAQGAPRPSEDEGAIITKALIQRQKQLIKSSPLA